MGTIGTTIFVIYFLVFCVLMIFCNLTKPVNFVKILFWPITAVVFTFIAIIGLSVYIIRNLYNGIVVCIEEIAEWFDDILYWGTDI